MVVSKIRFHDFNNTDKYTTSTVHFTYKGRRYSASTLSGGLNFKVLSICKLDGVCKEARIRYTYKEMIVQAIEEAYNALWDSVSGEIAEAQGLEFNTLLNHFNEYQDSNSELDLWDWMDTMNY